jgi:hypothetical protein
MKCLLALNLLPVNVPQAPSLEIKRQGRENDHSPQSGAEVKNAWHYTSTPQYIFMAWCLIKQEIRVHDTVLS